MMTDHDLALALSRLQELERTLREALKTDDQAERDQILNAVRLATPLRRSMETWMSLRALRAQLGSATTSVA